MKLDISAQDGIMSLFFRTIDTVLHVWQCSSSGQLGRQAGVQHKSQAKRGIACAVGNAHWILVFEPTFRVENKENSLYGTQEWLS